MDLKELTNIELLYHADLKNKVLIQIPNTPYHILCTYVKKSDTWNLHILELLSTKRKKIATNVTQETATEIIKRTTADGKTRSLKHVGKINQFAENLKSTVNKQNKKQHKNGIQQNRIRSKRNRSRRP